MGKNKKPTPQELYWARKQKEEEEKDAHLPPGLINHGNTCFMNSTLQGLIATPLLHSLADFEDPVPSSSSYPLIAARKSPQLTNGHGRGGQYERAWEQGMPLGDVFVALLRRAWDIQENQKRESMSPKDILTTIGRKYDQYLDFRQQDAHEFLTHLLDAIRLEEVDIIKKRQPPPPPPPKGRRRRTRQPSNAIPEEDKLVPFVDMVFGGRLASILVCDTCKKISVTHEDFNDLSLSIKPEDYMKERKRDRFKDIAKKLRLIPKARSQRSSSVPTSPIRRSLNLSPDHVDPPVDVDSRRRSLEHIVGAVEPENSGGGPAEPAPEAKPSLPAVEVAPKDEPTHISFAEANGNEGEKGDKGDKKDDAWGKISRRISMSMGGAAKTSLEKRLSRSKPSSRNASRERPAASTSSPRIQVSSPLVEGVLAKDINVNGAVDLPSPPLVLSPAVSPPTPRMPSPFRQHSSLGQNDHIKHSHAQKSQQRPYKPSREESEYMRRVLADVHPAGSTFSMIHQALIGAPTSTPLSAQALLVKMGHLPGIEECLRLFTSVEVLEGDNMVGCHRCWKIAQGTYKPRKEVVEEESEEEGDDESQPSSPLDGTERVARPLMSRTDTTSSVDVTMQGYVSPASTTLISDSADVTSFVFSDSASVSSAPTTFQSVQSAVHKPPMLALHAETEDAVTAPVQTPDAPLPSYGGIPIPLISTTEPDTPLSSPSPIPEQDQEEEEKRSDAVIRDTLQPPTTKKYRAGKRGPEEEDEMSGDESYDSASDASADVSVYSDASSVASPSASPSVSPRASVERLPRIANAESEGSTSRKIPRSEQVVLRRTYKRYLIATPPPVLVIHLKRFQQTSKSPYAMSFSSGFKKLDDFVSFPEYLDLAPYLAPKKEDFGLSRSKHKEKGDKDAACMYRLYAVVVHIGNMLGGHYIAYTALPSKDGQKSSPATTPASGEKPPVPSEHKRQWAYISDTNVRLVSFEEVLKAKAYLCMYERI
ncbi:cysteine proteinase [Trametopsis cervina]|nr:cysteine proteinase [Trametopsis cervina]